MRDDFIAIPDDYQLAIKELERQRKQIKAMKEAADNKTDVIDAALPPAGNESEVQTGLVTNLLPLC